MRDQEEVQAKFENLYRRRLSQRRERFLRREHINCVHNVRLRMKGHGKCGFCRNQKIVKATDGGPFVCDEEGTALRCKEYECRNTPQSVENEFKEILASPARCGNEYPKLAILIWFFTNIEERRTRTERLAAVLNRLISSLNSLILWRWW